MEYNWQSIFNNDSRWKRSREADKVVIDKNLSKFENDNINITYQGPFRSKRLS